MSLRANHWTTSMRNKVVIIERWWGGSVAWCWRADGRQECCNSGSCQLSDCLSDRLSASTPSTRWGTCDMCTFTDTRLQTGYKQAIVQQMDGTGYERRGGSESRKKVSLRRTWKAFSAVFHLISFALPYFSAGNRNIMKCFLVNNLI